MADGGPDKSKAKRRPTRRLPPNKRQGRWDLRLEEARARRTAALAKKAGDTDRAGEDEDAVEPSIILHDERELHGAQAVGTRAPDPFSGSGVETAHAPAAAAPEPEDVARARVAAEARDSSARPRMGGSRRLLWAGVAYGLLGVAAVYTAFELGFLTILPSAPEFVAVSPVSGPLPEAGAVSVRLPVLAVIPSGSKAAPERFASVSDVHDAAFALRSQPPTPIERPLPDLGAEVPRPNPLNSLAAPRTPPLEAVVEMRFDERYRGRPAMMPFNLKNAIASTAPPPPLPVIPRLAPISEVAVTPTLLLPLRPAPPAPRPGFDVPVYPASEAGDWRPEPRPTLAAPAALEAQAPAEETTDAEVLAAREENPESLTDELAEIADGAQDQPTQLVPETVAPRSERIVLFAPGITSDTELGFLGDQIRGMGFADVTERRHQFGIADTQIRYYHLSDRDVALALSEIFQGTARDFTGFSPRPEPGLIEVWLPGEAPVSRTARAPAASGADDRGGSPIDAVERTITRILEDILP